MFEEVDDDLNDGKEIFSSLCRTLLAGVLIVVMALTALVGDAAAGRGKIRRGAQSAMGGSEPGGTAVQPGGTLPSGGRK
ncbi:MAG: hypothetical protein MPW15_13995 [Candidatus Manganitrophus sp.]|nr:hypothetical protein [Candidatus Manganitrophus sp.]